uniref:Uncharacterized protein n=1 Tax=Ralstonia syzygii R24 TaxID=907261 RepID=G3A3M3_9RALS|nr:hypothetical protein RALSY_30222 [Ralstonia syzygii R24]
MAVLRIGGKHHLQWGILRWSFSSQSLADCMRSVAWPYGWEQIDGEAYAVFQHREP